jgi:Sec-independent protein translocase protein TatA
VLLLVVWIAVAVLAGVVLGALAYGLVGALRRLQRELAAFQHELQPVVAQVQATAVRAADTSTSP